MVPRPHFRSKRDQRYLIMKILNVIGNLDEKSGGGATERAYQMSLYLAQRGHDVSVLTTDHELTPARIAATAPAKVVVLKCMFKRFFVPSLFSLGKVARSVRAADVVHIVSHWTTINVVAYLAALAYRKPYVVCPLGALPIFGRSKWIKRFFNFTVGKRLIRDAGAHIIATPNEIPAFRDYGVAKDQIIHIPNGISSKDYISRGDAEFRRRIGINDHPFVLFMGRLNLIKGPDLLIEAFQSVSNAFPNYHLVYIGNDEGLGAPLRERVRALNLSERVHFLGFVSREDKSRVIHSADLLVVPSRQEAMSIVVLEAGVTGKPALITDQCGFDEVADVGGGKVVPATAEGIAQGLRDLLGQPENLQKMGARLQKLTEENYLWPAIAQKYETLFTKLISH